MTTTLLHLTPAESDLIRRLSTALIGYDPVEDADAYVLQAQLQSARVPKRIRRAILLFRRYGTPTGGLVIRGVPVDETPPTPTDASLAMGVRLAAARAMSVMASVLGDQFGFLPELSGQLIQDILPVAGFEDTQHSISSRALLELHCETAFTDNRADFIGLLCLRPDPDLRAGTLLSSAEMILPLLDPAVVSVLQQPRFVTTVDGSFLRGSRHAGPIYIGPITILSDVDGQPRIRCDFAETHGLDPVAQQAVHALHDAASTAAVEVRLRAGDLIFIDNHRAFHGRTPFRARHDGTDRWLLRTFITRDLCRSAADRPGDGRIVDTDYSAAPTAMPAEFLAGTR